MAKHRRGKLFIDIKVQGALVIRVLMYWFYCLLAVALLLACWTVFNERAETSGELFRAVWMQYGPALVATFLLLPIVLLDCLRFSNRFAGPVYRLRQTLRQLAAGEEIQPVKLRKDDFWHEFAAEFNAAVVERQPLPPAESAEPKEPAAAEPLTV